MINDESKFIDDINQLTSRCSRQYFSFPRCKDQMTCTKNHVHRVYYPCLHYYLGNCKYGFNCKFSHNLVSKVPPNSPEAVCFFSLMGGCDKGNECDKRHVTNVKELMRLIKFEH